MLLLSTVSYSQDYRYCEVQEVSLLSKTIIKLDFGQRSGFFSSGNLLVDDEGKEIKFNSGMQAVNYMAEYGWELFFAIPMNRNASDGAKDHEIHHANPFR